MIPRDGGNQYHGSIFATAGDSGFQSDNLDDDLIALGFTAQNRVKSVYDVNLTFGGPKRNRLFMAASQSIYAVYVATQGAGPA